jgi:uncharacterized protein YbjQ (UPF0145 family)
MRKSGFALLLAIASIICTLPTNAEESTKKSVLAQNTAAQATIDSSNTAGGIIVSTTPSLEGFRIKEYRGIVRGVMVREPNTIQQFKAGFQGMFGGKVNAYIRNCETGRQGAYDGMVQQALARGANAIVGVKYDSDAFQGGSNDFGTEIVCYGTAVVVERIQLQQP